MLDGARRAFPKLFSPSNRVPIIDRFVPLIVKIDRHADEKTAKDIRVRIHRICANLLVAGQPPPTIDSPEAFQG
jgi:hypothetical protein